MAASQATAFGTAARFAVFSVSGRLLALPAAAVRRFLPIPLLERLPAAPPVVEGVFRYRGQTVPVLRLDLLLGLPVTPAGLYAPLLLIERDGRPLALLADRVHDVAPVAAGTIGATGEGLSLNGCAAGTIPYGDALAVLLAPERLLTETEDHLLAAFRALADERLARWQTAPEGSSEGPAEDPPR